MQLWMGLWGLWGDVRLRVGLWGLQGDLWLWVGLWGLRVGLRGLWTELHTLPAPP